MAGKFHFATLAFVLAGCASQSPADAEKQASTAPASTASAAASGKAEVIAVAARSESVANETYSFDYSYPAKAGVIPGLKALLDADLAKHRSQLARSAAEAKKMAQKDNFPFNPYSFGKGWEVVTDLPAWLSLSAGFSTYEGGAHPNHGFDALLWDKRASKMRDALELFQSDRAFVEAVRGQFCKALDKERAERRAGQAMEGFDDCIDPAETVIILGSSSGRAFDRVGFLIGPYLAGPYSEGDYELTLPVTAALLARVKPQYRASFVEMK